MNNPFTPPSARVTDGTAHEGSPVKAVLLGVLVDIGGSVATGIILAIIYGASLASSGATAEQIEAAFASIPADSWISIAGIVVGTLLSLLAGYVCARVAKHSEFGLSAILAMISISFGLLVGAKQYSFILSAAFALTTFLAVMFGTRLGVARNIRDRASEQDESDLP